MSITTYSELVTAVERWLHREDDSTIEDRVPEFIALAEAEMQTKLKLLEFESDSSITITSGSGTLPTGFLGFRSVYWNGDTKHPLSPASPAHFDSLRNQTGGTPSVYFISGSTIRLNEEADGTAIGVANIRFTALSESNTTNAILTNFPDAYLFGALKHASVFTKDDVDVQKYGLMFNAACDRIDSNNRDRKYAGPLQVRAR